MLQMAEKLVLPKKNFHYTVLHDSLKMNMICALVHLICQLNIISHLEVGHFLLINSP